MKRAFFVGRFQPLHNAHLKVIKSILKDNDEIIIGIGSSQEKDTFENPFSFKERKEMITKCLKEEKISRFRILPVPDLFDDRKWVDYIIRKIPKFNSVYSGNPWTIRCFRKNKVNIKKIRLIKGLSSTIIRDRMIKDSGWKELVPDKIFDFIIDIKGDERLKKSKPGNTYKPGKIWEHHEKF